MLARTARYLAALAGAALCLTACASPAAERGGPAPVPAAGPNRPIADAARLPGGATPAAFAPLLVQEQQAPAASPPAAEREPKRWMIGTEIDLLPFLLDGWYVSAIAGYGHWRARFVLTDATTPDFTTASGFDDNQLDVQAYIVDYYFREGFEGWWIGPGFEVWDGDVRQESTGERRAYTTYIATLGGGYTFRFNDHLYLNPWAAVHVPVGGDTEVEFPGDTFEVGVTAEVSIKLGIHF